MTSPSIEGGDPTPAESRHTDPRLVSACNSRSGIEATETAKLAGSDRDAVRLAARRTLTIGALRQQGRLDRTAPNRQRHKIDDAAHQFEARDFRLAAVSVAKVNREFRQDEPLPREPRGADEKKSVAVIFDRLDETRRHAIEPHRPK